MLLTNANASSGTFTPSQATNDWPGVPDSAGLFGPRSFSRAAEHIQGISLMLWPERLLIYTSVFTLRPKRCLEIGTFQGGSAALIVAALDDIGDGQLVCIDPEPKIGSETWARIAHRATMVAAPSPEGIAVAAGKAGGKFDWALIDGNHSYQCLINDLEGTLPVLSNGAYILFHDAYYNDVDAGLKAMFIKHSHCLTDLGMISACGNPDARNPGVTWGGIRMARYQTK
jgi:hypothetical protein